MPSSYLPLLLAAISLCLTEAVFAEATGEDVCSSPVSTDPDTLDSTHGYLTSLFCEPALWFDNFFADDRIYEEVTPGTMVRWRNEYRYAEEGEQDFATSISAKMRLPRVSKRLRLVFESDDQDEISDIIPSDTENAEETLSFLYDFFDTEKINVSLRLSLRPSLTARFRYTHPVNDTLITRFTQNVFREEGHFGTNSRYDVEKTIAADKALRWSTSAEVIEDIDGATWASGIVYYRRLSQSDALSYELGVEGETRPHYLETDYRIGVRYRRRFHRSWLFYEIAPEVTWPVETIVDEREPVAAIVFVLEAYFDSRR